MRVTLRTKLAAIGFSTALAFVVVFVTSTVVTRRVDVQLSRVQERLIPKLTLGPQLERDFATLKRGYQDAVAAHDAEALERTRDLRDRILEQLDRGREVLDPAATAAFRVALAEYHEQALDVSRRMMTGEGGEGLVESIAMMQRRHAHAEEVLGHVTSFDENELKRTFSIAREAEVTGARTQLGSTLACLAVVLALSLWLSRSFGRSLGRLEDGFTRFATGKLDTPIVVGGHDEITRVAAEANRMAENLARFAAERERSDWIKTGIVELTQELRGELEEEEVAARAAQTLARYLNAPAAALYVVRHDERSKLVLLGHHVVTRGLGPGDAAPAFEMGEGLVGQAARSSDLVVIDPAPPDFLRVRSGLGESAPSVLALVPLVRGDEVGGVLELAFFESLSGQARELLLTARENVAVSLAVAQSRASTRRLLTRTQEQAARLVHQEEELKSTNEELRCQQEELQQTNEELAEHARQLAQQRVALQAKNSDLELVSQRLEQQAAELTTVSAYKSQFLANMSHELRTPLNSMLLLSKLLADNGEGNLTPKQLEYSRTIHAAGKDLLLLINQVLDLAKVEAGKQEVHLEPIRLDHVVERLRQVFTPLAKEKGLRLVVEIAKGMPETITTDGQRLGQILTNLVGNAIKFTERGEVELRVGRPDDSVMLRNPALLHETTIAFSVTDTGAGIAPEHQERIFAPFEQVDGSARRRQGGTGLGLTISRELAALLGGELQLRSVPGEGSTFSCYVPEGAAGPARKIASDGPVAPAAVSETRRPEDRPSDVHLLVIEDDPVFSDVLGQIIHERGLVYLTARDGKTGLRLARERRPRGIILDVKLPDLDGWRVMEELRADPSTASIPVHFISGVAMPERGLAMGAAGYLIKPAERQDLVRVVEGLGPKLDRTAHRVLVVEDDAAAGETLVEQLASAGLGAIRATNTPHALELLERERFACMILDLSVPDTRELELLDELQRRGRPDMPAVVIYTSRQLSRPEVARLEAYAEAVILKDGQASTERLLDEIRLFIRRLEAGLPRRSLGPRRRGIDVRLEGKKILVVDDDMRTAYALSATLRGKGAEVLVADNGAVALDVLAENPDVQAILMDVMMPEMDGHEATRRIRKQPAFERLPIIALTAKAMKGDEARCLEAGATAYLPKPIDADVLLELLHTRIHAEESSE
jgi:signal transduction histidine kinase/CheY-like chemotaxis protein/HAMP domain-containing protein